MALNTRMVKAEWDDAAHLWNFTCKQGEDEDEDGRKNNVEGAREIKISGRYFINAAGPLRIPKFPDIPGVESDGKCIFSGLNFIQLSGPRALNRRIFKENEWV